MLRSAARFSKDEVLLATTLLVIGFYTGIAHVIPQLQSEVPEALSLTGDMTPEVMMSAGERVYNGAGGCTACHGLGTRAPNLLSDHAGQGPIGARCGSRVKTMDCKAYLYQSMTNPGGFIVAGFEPIMPDMRRQLSEDQIWATVAFLESQGGEVTVTAADMKSAAKPAGPPAPVGAARLVIVETRCDDASAWLGTSVGSADGVDAIARADVNAIVLTTPDNTRKPFMPCTP